MLDIHTHILPGIDDGSPSSEMSLMMLQKLKEQGVTAVCLTPHFYADVNDPDRFLKKRAMSYDRLLAGAEKMGMDQLPLPVLLGAEVLYFNGMSRCPEVLESLCYKGSKILLLEMPFHKWTSRMVDEVLQIQHFSGLKVVLAHVERYWAFTSDDVFQQFRHAGIRMHLNCSCLLNWRSRKKALNEIKNGHIQFLASDAHNLTSRAPCFDEAFAVLEKKGLQDAAERFKQAKL